MLGPLLLLTLSLSICNKNLLVDIWSMLSDSNVVMVTQILVMFHHSLQEDKCLQRWRMAFRVTIQKCLLGAVILATGSRAVYYTVQNIIPDKWGDILLNVYYPSLLSAISLLICFWAEVTTDDGCVSSDVFGLYMWWV